MHIRNLFSISIFLLCSAWTIQSMELIIESPEKNPHTPITTPVQELTFYPVGPRTDIILNFFLKKVLVDNKYFNVEKQLPAEIWQKIWRYLDHTDKLNFSLSTKLCDHIRQHVQLDGYRQLFLKSKHKDLYGKQVHSLHFLHKYTQKIRDVQNNTELDGIKIKCEVILKDIKPEVQDTIAAQKPNLMNKRHYSSTEQYKELKYLDETFNERNMCGVCCAECAAESCNVLGDCCSSCCWPCLKKSCLYCCYPFLWCLFA